MAVNSENVLKTYYIKYLKEIRGVSDSSVKHYQEALRYISKYLAEKGMIHESIYEIQDIDQLKEIRTYLYSDPEFCDLNSRGHQMYSAGLNNYFKFADGTGFADIHQQIEVMDFRVEAPEITYGMVRRHQRSTIIKDQTIESAGYNCEIDGAHNTFTSARTGHPYMEGHHALPMKYQSNFDYSLDVYANIVCLCPICHRLLHYGVESEKKFAVDKIYNERADRLAASGIRISKENFERMVI